MGKGSEDGELYAATVEGFEPRGDGLDLVLIECQGAVEVHVDDWALSLLRRSAEGAQGCQG